MRKVYKNNSCLIVLTHPPYFRDERRSSQWKIFLELSSIRNVIRWNSHDTRNHSQNLKNFPLSRDTINTNDRNFLRSIRDNTVPRREFRGSAVVMRVSEADWRTHETSSRNWRRLIAASYRDSLSTSARSTGSVLLAAPLQSPPRRDYRK